MKNTDTFSADFIIFFNQNGPQAEKGHYRKSNGTSRSTRAKIEKWNPNDNPEKVGGGGGGERGAHQIYPVSFQRFAHGKWVGCYKLNYVLYQLFSFDLTLDKETVETMKQVASKVGGGGGGMVVDNAGGGVDLSIVTEPSKYLRPSDQTPCKPQ